MQAQIFSPLLEEITGARLYSATCGSGTMGLREFAAAVAYAMGLWYSPEALEDSEDVRKTREVLHCSPPRPARAPGPPTIDAADPFGDSEPSEAGRSAGTSPKETGNGRGGEGDKASPKGRGPAGSGGQVESGDEEEAGGGRGLRESRSRRGQERGKGGGRRERGVSGDSSGEERGGRGKGRDRRESSVSGDSSGDERGERGGRSERSASVASSVESERPRKSDSDVISFEKSIAAVPESVVSVTEDEPCGENSGSSGAGRGRRREGSSAAVKTESESEGGAEAEDGAEATTRETGTQADDGLSAGRNAGEGGDGQWARVNVVDARAERECGEGGDEDWLGCRISVNAYITAPRRKEAKAVTTASATQTQREEVETATQGTQCDAPVAERRAQRERARDGPVAEKPREKSERVMPAVDIWAREEGEGDEGEGR